MRHHRSIFFYAAVISACAYMLLGTVGRGVSAGPAVSANTVDTVDITVVIDGRLQKTRAVSILNADVKTIWQVITDFDRHEEFMPNVAESKIISSSGDRLIVYKQLKVALQKISFSLDVKLDNNNHAYSWSQHEGPFKVNSGSWKLESRGDHTLVEYVALVEPDFYLPAWIKKILVKKSVPKLFRSIENEALRITSKKD